MQFEKGRLYHIFNQGNNRQRIFFNDNNYLFFLQKIKTHISPFADVLAWCLMPNHFHLMVKVTQVELPTSNFNGSATLSRAPIERRTAISNHPPNSRPTTKNTNINKEIGIMLASYTRAIQKQENISGTLFRQKTKAECLDDNSAITPSFYNTQSGTKIHIDKPENRYPLVCFNYIHQNPVKAHLVSKAEDWHWSSYRDAIGLRNGTLINRQLLQELELINLSDSETDTQIK